MVSSAIGKPPLHPFSANHFRPQTDLPPTITPSLWNDSRRPESELTVKPLPAILSRWKKADLQEAIQHLLNHPRDSKSNHRDDIYQWLLSRNLTTALTRNDGFINLQNMSALSEMTNAWLKFDTLGVPDAKKLICLIKNYPLILNQSEFQTPAIRQTLHDKLANALHTTSSLRVVNFFFKQLSDMRLGFNFLKSWIRDEVSFAAYSDQNGLGFVRNVVIKKSINEKILKVLQGRSLGEELFDEFPRYFLTQAQTADAHLEHPINRWLVFASSMSLRDESSASFEGALVEVLKTCDNETFGHILSNACDYSHKLSPAVEKILLTAATQSFVQVPSLPAVATDKVATDDAETRVRQRTALARWQSAGLEVLDSLGTDLRDFIVSLLLQKTQDFSSVEIPDDTSETDSLQASDSASDIFSAELVDESNNALLAMLADFETGDKHYFLLPHAEQLSLLVRLGAWRHVPLTTTIAFVHHLFRVYDQLPGPATLEQAQMLYEFLSAFNKNDDYEPQALLSAKFALDCINQWRPYFKLDEYVAEQDTVAVKTAHFLLSRLVLPLLKEDPDWQPEDLWRALEKKPFDVKLEGFNKT